MLFSELIYDELPIHVLTELMFPLSTGAGSVYDCAIVFGGSNPKRIQPAVELALAGLCDTIVVSGARVKDSRDMDSLLEADHMAQYALERGVPMNYLLREPRATNTKENVLYSLAVLVRERDIHRMRRIAIVSHPAHVKRAWMTARTYFPESIEFIPHAAPYMEVNRNNWWKSERGTRYVSSEFEKIQRYIRTGDIFDEEVSVPPKESEG